MPNDTIKTEIGIIRIAFFRAIPVQIVNKISSFVDLKQSVVISTCQSELVYCMSVYLRCTGDSLMFTLFLIFFTRLTLKFPSQYFAALHRSKSY